MTHTLLISIGVILKSPCPVTHRGTFISQEVKAARVLLTIFAQIFGSMGIPIPSFTYLKIFSVNMRMVLKNSVRYALKNLSTTWEIIHPIVLQYYFLVVRWKFILDVESSFFFYTKPERVTKVRLSGLNKRGFGKAQGEWGSGEWEWERVNELNKKSPTEMNFQSARDFLNYTNIQNSVL